MKHILLAAAAALLLHVPGARAATFDLSVIGSGTHWYADTATFITETWLGDITLQTASDADGTYGVETGLESLSYSSNFDGFDYTAGDTQHLVYPCFWPGDPYLAGMAPGVSVTLVSGRVTSIDASFVWDGTGSVDLTGLEVTDYHGGQLAEPNADWWNLSGALVDGTNPATSSAPEPETWLMFVVGLLVFKRIAPNE